MELRSGANVSCEDVIENAEETDGVPVLSIHVKFGLDVPSHVSAFELYRYLPFDKNIITYCLVMIILPCVVR